MVNHHLTMNCIISLLFVLTFFCANVQTQLPVNPEPPGAQLPPAPPAENTYEAPVLQGGLGTVTDGKEAEVKRRRYPDRSSSYSQAYDPGSAFRTEQGPLPQSPVVNPQQQPPPSQEQQQSPQQVQQQQTQKTRGQQKTFAYDPYPARNATYDNVETRQLLAPVTRVETTTIRIPNPKVGSTTRDPFNDPNRYRIPSQTENQEDVRFVNGRPYR